METQPSDERIILLEKDSTIYVESKLVCQTCQKLLLNQKTLVRHMKLAHGVKPAMTGTTECPVEGCQSLFPSVGKVREHLASAHDLQQPCERKVFVNFEAFLKWKSEEESRTASSYVKTSSSQAIHSRPGSFKARYRCHRSGKYKSHSTGKKTLKSQKSCKMGRLCPAGMEVETSPSPDCSVTVSLWPTHYGHKQDLGHLWLSTKERNAIAVKISQGRTFDEILDEIRRDVDGGISRLHLIKRKDLHNIMHSYNLKGLAATAAASVPPTPVAEPSAVADVSPPIPADVNQTATSSSRVSIGRGQFTDNEVQDVGQWVLRMQQQLGDESPVLLYHEPGAETPDGGLVGPDDFILVVMTSGQRQVLLRFGQDRVCLDVMQRAAADEFSLTILLVLDESGHALPAAFCFSAEADERAMTSFLIAVRDRVGPVNCRTFLSNATPLCYDAWLSAMAVPARSLLPCLWHMDRSWRQKIAQTVSGGEAVRDRAYVALRSLLRSKDSLIERQAAFVAELNADPHTRAFAQYFESTYVGLLESWGGGAPPIGAKNEYTRLAAYHKICRHIYANNRRYTDLDACLSAMLRKARDKIFERLTKLATDAVDDRALATLRRHQRSALIAPSDLAVVEEGRQWRVFDRSVTSEFLVFKEGDACPECDQREHCDECRCDICPHVYLCTCDSQCARQMCEHVHAIVTNFVFGRPVPPSVSTGSDGVGITGDAQDREAEMQALSVAVADAVPQSAASTPADDELLLTTGSRLNLLTCLMQREGRNAPDAETLREVNALLDRCVSLLKDKPIVSYKRQVAESTSRQQVALMSPSVAVDEQPANKRVRRTRKAATPIAPIISTQEADPVHLDGQPYQVVGTVCDEEGESAVVSIQEVRTLLVGDLGDVEQGEFNSFHLDGEQIIKICYAIPSDHCYC